jgi:hypothetical protein
METGRPWAGAATRYGAVGENAAWRNALEHYYWDRLEPAMEVASSLGVGVGGYGARTYRLIEAEFVTRRRSRTEEVQAWMRLETIPEEVEGAAGLADGILRACEEVGRRFEWDHRAPVLVSVLAAESDAPWAVGRYGYCIDKFPFDKVCLPQAAAHHPEHLHQVTAHEYAHVVVLNLTQGQAPRWLDEAVAMVAQRDVDEGMRAAFASGEQPWRSPHDLELAFGAEGDEAEDAQRVWAAYQQSALIGHYLADRHGEASLGRLLRAFSDNSPWTELKMRLVNQSPADEALRETFGFGEDELFERAAQAATG